MKLFRRKAKDCCAKVSCTPELMQQAESMKSNQGIKVLGSGCAKCQQLEQALRLAVDEMKLECSIEHVSDFVQIASYGVMSMPALVIDGKVVSYGKVLSVEEAKALLKEYFHEAIA